MGTVLVSGGSGPLGGWCLIQALQAGHDVRTTVRKLAREPQVREGARAPRGRRRAPLVLHRRPRGRRAAGRRRSTAATTSCSRQSFFPRRAQGPDELIVPARDGTLRALRTAWRPACGESSSPPRRRRSASAVVPPSGRSRSRTGPTLRTQGLPACSLENDRRAGGVGLGHGSGRDDRLSVVNPGGDRRAHPER